MIAITKGLDMPPCCDKCMFLDVDGKLPWCRLTFETTDDYPIRNRRMDNCPLVELPNR